MLGSGREQRVSAWSQARRRYEVGGAVRTLEEAYALIAFFEARLGRLHGFRFRDPLDWRSGPVHAPVQPTDQALGTGDGVRTSFALVKRYDPGAVYPPRRIRKPLAGTVRAAVAGLEAPQSAYAVDPVDGLITFVAAPAAGAAVTAGFEFDTPVRFDTDSLDLEFEAIGVVRPGSVPLVEILA
jgi:uncharacterized protein (TIGR02217 family)